MQPNQNCMSLFTDMTVNNQNAKGKYTYMFNCWMLNFTHPFPAPCLETFSVILP